MSAELEVAEALVIKPGDVLVVRVHSQITHSHAEAIRERAMALLPELADVVVIGGADQIAVFRPDPIEIVPLEAKRRP